MRKVKFSILFLVVLGLMACATTGQQTTQEKPFEVKAWGALKVSIAAYDGAMGSLKELYAVGIIPKDTAQKAWDAGEAFYLAQKGSLAALRTYVEMKNAINQQATNAAIIQAGLRLADFTILVTPFIAKYLVDDLNAAQAGLKGGK